MITTTSITSLRSAVNEHRLDNSSIGFVPTMGALHEGHASLIRQARAENDIVLVSLFVNPTQFNDESDLAKYPNTLDADNSLCESIGVDYLFLPSVTEMYPKPMDTVVDVPSLSAGLIGKVRPGHFQGVASVVTKLLNIANADRAYFGEKDYQQLAIIKRLVSDLNFATTIVGVPTVREPDGLAMSSRNLRLTKEDRQAATVIYRSIDAAQHSGLSLVSELIELIRRTISHEPRATIQSIDIVDADSLEELACIDRPAALLLTVQFGDILLIDQAMLQPLGATQ